MRIAVVRILNSPRVFDRTPVLLGSPCNFNRVGEHAVPIGAMHAIDAFESVQVSQFVAVNRDVIPAARFGYAVDRKANRLIYGYKQVQQDKWNDDGINEWRRKNREDSGMQDVTDQRTSLAGDAPA